MGYVTITRGAEEQAAAALYAALITLHTTGQESAAAALLAGVSDELADRVATLADRDVAGGLAAALKASHRTPTQPDRPQPAPAQPQRDPQSREALVHRALVEALATVGVQLPADRLPEQWETAFGALVRRVTDVAQEDGVTVVEVLTRLGTSKLTAVTRVDNPSAYLAAKVRDWTPGDDFDDTGR
ncbi:hypothetical protein [Amycolatopsis sp. lyj-23]|uniref:hypothetical protein n=1 Tax=Amycolatopsis sp. lyj-23 TaxID=2789283 RepID=UPI003978F2B6